MFDHDLLSRRKLLAGGAHLAGAASVLAVAGAARDYPYILVFGLVLSIGLMGLAASFIARLLQQHRWVAYVGLVIIVYVAFEMTWRGGLEVLPLIRG